MNLRKAGLWVLVACAWGVTAWGNPYLDEARKHYEALRFAEALEQLRIARQVPTNDAAEKREILDLLARCQVAEGQRAEAEATFSDLLAQEPAFELPRSVSPKIREAFDTAKRRLYPPDFAALEALPAPPGQARARLVDPWAQVATVVLITRAETGGVWKESPATLEEGVAVLSLAREGQKVEWYAEARRADGRALAALGSERAPLAFEAVPEQALGLGAVAVEHRPLGRTVAASIATALGAGALIAGVALQLKSAASHEEAVREEQFTPAQRLQERAVLEASWSAGLFAGAGVAGVAAGVLWVW